MNDQNSPAKVDSRPRRHPDVERLNQFNAAIAAWVMREFTSGGDEVLDPFAGAGWAVLGAEQCGRKARAIELSADYCAVILQRWADATGKTPELIDESKPAKRAGRKAKS